MDIRNWNPNQIMQLPDYCFGPRWWVGEYLGATDGNFDYAGGTEILPHRLMLWGVLVSARSPACLEALRLTIRLGGSPAVTVADALKLERLFKHISIPTIMYELYVKSNGVTWIGCERQFVEPNGRKLSICSNGDQVIQYEMTVGILISAVPTEVPDWLVNAQGVP